ncbi:formimidoylglutamase [Solitalea koreensis]|uniref:Arginase family enzyme n=1 Tax=Solitalea koreensis TaxID=543615 RepID=A0A521C0K5_9SPHI|nr:formimidoylglutamase [Solitalea koreensis]SMO52260.1 Arginase family enzyme [Solitalea koreensis]
MNLSDFLSPVNLTKIKPDKGYSEHQLGAIITTFKEEDKFPEMEGINLAIVGVEDDRNAINNEGCAQAPDAVREYLYKLCEGSFQSKMVDLGNIRAGESARDTYIALRIVCSELMKADILPIIIGGGQDLTFPQYLAYEDLEQRVDLVVIDDHFDLNEEDEDSDLTSTSYLNKIILHQPNNLFNFSNIGYQTYFASQNSLKLMDKMYFDTHRLGEVTQQVQEMEPVIRNANMLSFDCSAIRQSNAPGNANAGPNGLYGEEACQLCRYAGMSDKLLSIGFYEMNPQYDRHGQTAHLLAQMIWCFIDGFYNRKKDYPFNPTEEMTKYRAFLRDNGHEVVFYKSPKTDRWWMQVPYPNLRSKNERYYLVPCSYNDYQMASNGEVPDRWWRTYQKLL